MRPSYTVLFYDYMEASPYRIRLSTPTRPPAVLILAGGLSSRMRQEKATLTIDSKPLIRWTFEAAERISDHVYISVHDDDTINRFKSILPLRATYLTDIEEGPRSVLLALLSCFPRIQNEYTIIIPVDSPFINEEVFHSMVSKADGFDLVIPMWPDGRLEAIHAIFNTKTTLPVLNQMWLERKLEVKEIPKHVKRTLFISTESLSESDPTLLSLLDADTPDEFQALKRARSNETV